MTKVEEVLQSKNVHRQAYHSNSFIGNHCHVICKNKNYEAITDVAMQITNELGGSTKLTAMAMEIKDKFTPLFEKFSTCHMMFNSSQIVDPDILGKML